MATTKARFGKVSLITLCAMREVWASLWLVLEVGDVLKWNTLAIRQLSSSALLHHILMLACAAKMLCAAK